MIANPFLFGSPIRDREHFFGREIVLRQVMNRLRSMQDSSIIGERRIGKTSLLYYIQHPDVIHYYGLEAEKYLFVYFSFDGAGYLTPTRFWQRLLHSLQPRVNNQTLLSEIERLLAMDEIDPFDIEDLFLAISSKDLRVVFLLDEFETVTQATNLDADFFSHLRSLATGHYIGLIFVTSSRQKLSELSHTGIVGSPFFNIFETFFLKPFRPESATEAVTKLLSGTEVSFDPQEMAYLLSITGQHPFFLQMAASYLFDAYTLHNLKGERLRPARLERVEQEFILQATPHFDHYWKQSSNPEKIFLAALAVITTYNGESGWPDMQRMKQAYRNADISAQTLEDRGLVLRELGGYRIFSPAYSRWIMEEITRKSGHGDYQAWLNQNGGDYGGQLQLLYERAKEIGSAVNSKYWNQITEWLSKSSEAGEIINHLTKDVSQIKNQPIWLSFVGA